MLWSKSYENDWKKIYCIKNHIALILLRFDSFGLVIVLDFSFLFDTDFNTLYWPYQAGKMLVWKTSAYWLFKIVL